uniref:sigma-E processing peptidase SpoIIGA n=1 Tax=Agathobacter sp. TaxID=2021311 RepID=UPI004056342B
MSDTYIFYADVYFFQNFLIKSSVLYLTLWYQKYLPKGIMQRIGIAALAGTVFEIVSLISGAGYNVFLAAVHIAEVPAMMVFLIGKDKKYLVKAIVTGYFFILLINGILEIFWNMFGEKGDFLFFLFLSCGLVIVLVKTAHSHMKIEKYIFGVELLNQEKKLEIRGFYDTGNRLKEPYGQKGVHILSKDICEKLLGEAQQKMLVPYHALGNTKGLLEVFYVEKMKIRSEKQEYDLENAAIGIGEQKLFDGKSYEMIINEEAFQKK